VSSSFERDLRREMEQNLEGQKADYPAPCQICGSEFLYPARAVVFGGEVVCPHCGGTFTVSSDAADSFISSVQDFRRNIERRNRRRS
jgi:uncharacterized Zn finger protein (UPF0148 family)